MTVMYGLTNGLNGISLPVAVAEREDASGQVKNVESSKPFPISGLDLTTTVKSKPGILVNITISTALLGTVTISDGTSTFHTLPIGFIGVLRVVWELKTIVIIRTDATDVLTVGII